MADRLYGPTTIDEALLRDILASPAIDRLRGVLQHGVTALIGLTSPTTRYEHSVGVMLLVRRLGGDLAEQAAALIHDVSHTAFSHVIDYVFHDHDDQSFHDRHQADHVAQTDLPRRLADHGVAWRGLLDETRFPLLEQPSPALCADRLDYFLRDALDLGLARADDVDRLLDQLVVVGGRVGVRDIDAGRWLGETYMAADDASWSNFREVGLYELAARAIRRGLACGALTEAELWGQDRPVWQRLAQHPDPELQRWLRLVSPSTRFAWDEVNPTFVVTTKVRAVDPDVAAHGSLVPLSTLDPAFAARRAAYLHRKQGPWPIRVIAARK